MRKILFLSVLGLTLSSTAAMAQESGALVTKPEASAVSPSLAGIARIGDATMYGPTEFTIRHSHDIGKSQVGLGRLEPQAFASTPTSTPYNQTATYQPLGATLGSNFEAQGIGTPSFVIAGAPPDTTLGVSDTQIVQWVNSHIAVYNKAGAPLLPSPGFVPGNALWASLPPGSLCRDFNRGDPMVQYDRMADRWVLTQFAFNASFSSNAQCIAVSTTNNALGTYNVYQYGFGTVLPDYPKLGIWPDAYYITYNMFSLGASFAGGRACAYDRAAMIAGAAATSICFNSGSRFSFLPSDLDGDTPPPAGTPNYHISWNWAFLATSPYTMQLTKFKPDFVTPANSTFDDGFGGGMFSFVGFPLDAGTLAACGDTGGACVPQAGTANTLDTLGSRHMYRLVYRNFGSIQSLLFTQASDAQPGTTANLRWWEIRNPAANPPVVYQNANYIPNTEARWMGSAAFDKLGNIGIGYSASSAAINPGIRIAGRRRTDPKNLLRSEVTVMAGTGSQTGTLQRWGDYSAMQIDPADDCTFWYTTQYLGSNGTFNWRTRIVAFKFPNCTP